MQQQLIVTKAAIGMTVVLAGVAAWAEEPARWQVLANNPSCQVWNEAPQPQVTVTWTGRCVNGKAEGNGTLIWRYYLDGRWQEDRYVGDRLAGKAHGRGSYVSADGDRYEGDWRAGQPHGIGSYVGANGVRYEGEWAGNKPHGYGTFTATDGDVYAGNWTNGCFRQGSRWASLAASAEDCGFQ